MANIKVNVIDQNNVNIAVTPTPNQIITIDRSATGVGIESITAVDIDNQTYLDVLYTDGSTQQVGPLTSGVYFGVSPIVVTGDEISLDDTAVTPDTYGSASKSVTYTVDTKGRLTASQEQNIAIVLSQVTDAGTLAGQDTITASQISDAGDPNGVATLDSSGQVPLSQIPALGDLNYQGTWNASTNTPTLTSSVGTKGYYYVVSVAGTTNLNGITDWQIADWAVFNGSVWQKIDNTDAVTSVNGYTGTVVLTNTDISGFGTMSTQNANSVAITGGAIDGTTIGATTTSTGKFTTLNASTSLTTPAIQATNSGGLSLKNSAGTTQISMGGGGGDNVSINVSTNLNGSNAQIDISPTGTGHVHMKPTGTGSIEIAPTNVGTIDNMTIGATTPKAITGTTITATTFNGSGSGLTNVVNSLSASTGISVSGSTGAITVTNTAPDQTVTMTSGTGISVTGTYPNFTVTNTSPSSGGTVTSVTGTSPIASSGGTTPAISISQATTSTNGYLSSTDWNTFNGKQATLVSGSNIKTVNGTTLLGSGDLGTIGISYGGTGQTTANNAFNALAPSQTSNSGKYLKTDGTNTSWATVDALPSQTGHSGQYLTTDGSIASWATVNAGASLSNDTSTSSNLYPIFASATSGTPTTIYTSNAKYLYKPSTGELQASAMVSSNGINVNNATVSASYTIASGNNGLSVGPVTVASGQTVTVTSGQRWVIL